MTALLSVFLFSPHAHCSSIHPPTTPLSASTSSCAIQPGYTSTWGGNVSSPPSLP